MNPALTASLLPAALLVMLALAIHQDLLRQRIPNALSFGGLATGLALATMSAGTRGLGDAALGAAVGFAAFMPFYLGRGMGAGDVKLMAAAGSFLGPVAAFFAATAALAFGGLLAVGYVLWGRLRPASALERAVAADDPAPRPSLDAIRRQRFPYATAIGAGVVANALYRGQLEPLLTLITGGL